MNSFVLDLENNEFVNSTPLRCPSHEDVSTPVEVVERKHKREHSFRHASDHRDGARRQTVLEKREEKFQIDGDTMQVEQIVEILCQLKFDGSSSCSSAPNSEVEDHNGRTRIVRNASSNVLTEGDYSTGNSNMDAYIQTSCSNSSDEEEVLERSGHVGEEDDDWMDNVNQSDSFGRRKAPSGTACDRHKRWKKRCPEDCPFRSSRHKKSSSKFGTSSKLEEDPSDQILRLAYQLSSKLESDQSNWEETFTKLYQAMGSQISDMPKSKADCLAYVRNVLKQLHEVSSTKVTPKKTPASLAKTDFMYNDTCYSSDDCKDSASPIVKRKKRITDSSEKEKKQPHTIACEYHTMLHARCPPNCADRRPAKSRQETKIIVKAFESNVQIQPLGDVIPKRQKTDELTNETIWDTDSSMTSASDTDKEKKSKKKKTKKSNGNRSGRKYLPQACERHKLLHARCPANCPERLKRDTQKLMEQQLKLQQSLAEPSLLLNPLSEADNIIE